jgi:DNA-binding FadR family transcriptional regulator
MAAAITAGDADQAVRAARELLEPATAALISALSSLEDDR